MVILPRCARGSVRKRAFATHQPTLAVFFGASVVEPCSRTDATVENSFNEDACGFLKGSVDFLKTAEVLGKKEMKSDQVDFPV